MHSNNHGLPPFPVADDNRLLLMTCCAPCVCAAAECLIDAGFKPTLYFYNPNIQPEGEYIRRRDEVARVAELTGAGFVEEAYEPDAWHAAVAGYENEPERGERCRRCFALRLERAAQYAVNHGFGALASVLAFSRWKSADMGMETLNESVADKPLQPWHIDWRKHGRQERTLQLIRQWDIYNQTYCGCPYSVRTK